MKSLRQTCAVAVLSMALAVSVFAGQIGSPGAPAPAPEGTSASSIATTIILTIVSLIR